MSLFLLTFPSSVIFLKLTTLISLSEFVTDNLFDVYFTTVQLVLVPSGDGRTSTRTST